MKSRHDSALPPNGPVRRTIDYAGTLSRLGGDRELFEDMAGFFIADAPELMQRLARRTAEADAVGVAHAAHALLGTASNFGARAVTEIAERIERSARAGVVDGSGSDVRALDRAVEMLLAELRREVRSGNAAER